MASKPEKRVASSVFITLAPPRRDVAVAEEVRQAVCEAWRGRPWAAPAPVKTPEAGLARRPSPWTPLARLQPQCQLHLCSFPMEDAHPLLLSWMVRMCFLTWTSSRPLHRPLRCSYLLKRRLLLQWGPHSLQTYSS